MIAEEGEVPMVVVVGRFGEDTVPARVRQAVKASSVRSSHRLMGGFGTWWNQEKRALSFLI